MGKGFETAVAPAELCLVVANASLQACAAVKIVKKRLLDLGKKEMRAYQSNPFFFPWFRFLNGNESYTYDLDEVIDGTGIQLIAVVTENRQVVSAIQKGTSYSGKCTALEAVNNLAARIDGENPPLAVC